MAVGLVEAFVCTTQKYPSLMHEVFILYVIVWVVSL